MDRLIDISINRLVEEEEEAFDERPVTATSHGSTVPTRSMMLRGLTKTE